MRIALGSDHRGFDLKQELLGALRAQGHDCEDFGTYGKDPVDYPDFAAPVATAVSLGKRDLGILVCGTGIGMSVAANKVLGVRAALCHDEFTAQRARQHTNANILCLGAEQLDAVAAKAIVEAYLNAKFEERHQTRLDKVERLEKRPASIAEAKASYQGSSTPAAQDAIPGDGGALRIQNETPRQRARRQAEARRQMLDFIEEIEREAAASGVEGPADASENLDQYIY